MNRIPKYLDVFVGIFCGSFHHLFLASLQCQCGVCFLAGFVFFPQCYRVACEDSP